MRLHEIKERRAAAAKAMRELVNAAESGGRELSADEGKRFDELKGEIERLEADERRAEYIADLDRRAAATPASRGDERLDDELRSFSIVRAIAAQVPGMNVDAGRERELSQELARRSGRSAQGMLVPLEVFHRPVEQRVLTTAAPAGGPGGNLIQTDNRGDLFIDALRAALRIRQLGATVLTGLVGNVDVPRLKATGTAGWVAENAALTAADHQFDKVSLTPKHVGALTEFSRNMLMQTSPSIEQLVRADFAAILAGAMDRAAINGGGSNEPTGILATAGIGNADIGTNGGPITWAKVIDLVAAVEEANGVGAGFLTNAKVVKSARKTAKVASTDSVMVMESPDSLAGYPLVATNNVPSNLVKGTSGAVCSALIYGNWSDLLIGYWSEFDLLVNPFESTAYSKGNVQVRGMLTADVKLRQPASFAAIKDLTTA
jgi:HK97 family phage major capsid protein